MKKGMKDEEKEASNQYWFNMGKKIEGRRLKIENLQKDWENTTRKSYAYLVVYGAMLLGYVFAVDGHEMGVTEAIVKSLGNLDSMKEYLSQITPAMWVTFGGQIATLNAFIQSRWKVGKINKELDDAYSEKVDVIEDYTSEGRSR